MQEVTRTTIRRIEHEASLYDRLATQETARGDTKAARRMQEEAEHRRRLLSDLNDL